MDNFKSKIINPYDDAVVHDSMKGDQFEGVWQGGAYNGLSYVIDEITRTFNVLPGYGSIYGRQFELTESHEVSLIALTGIKYCIVYVEINLKNVTSQSVSIKLAYAGAGYPDLESDDLIRNKNGIARMPLYKFLFNAVAEEGEVFTDVEQLFYTYESGTAEHVNIIEGSGEINERQIHELIHFNADRFKKAEHAVHTTLGRKLGESEEDAVRISDTLQLLDSGYSDLHLAQVSRGVFRITGQEHKTEPTEAMVLDENKTYNFFYTPDAYGGALLPQGAKVIGVIVTGSIMLSQWDIGFFGIGSGWQPWRSKQAMGNHDQSGWGFADDRRMNDQLTIFGGDIFRENNPLHLVPFDKMDKDYFGFRIDREPAGFLSDGSPVNGPVTFTFKNTNAATPYIQVKVADNYRLQIDLTFRLIYIGGEISWNKEDKNIFPTNPGVGIP